MTRAQQKEIIFASSHDHANIDVDDDVDLGEALGKLTASVLTRINGIEDAILLVAEHLDPEVGSGTIISGSYPGFGPEDSPFTH